MDDASKFKFVFVLLLGLYCNYEHHVQCLHSFAEAFVRQMCAFTQPHSRRERGGVEDAEKVHVRVYFAIVFLFLLMVKFRMSMHTHIRTIP